MNEPETVEYVTYFNPPVKICDDCVTITGVNTNELKAWLEKNHAKEKRYIG